MSLPSRTTNRTNDRYSYDAEKKVAREFWSRRLTAVLKEKASASAARFKSSPAWSV